MSKSVINISEALKHKEQCPLCHDINSVLCCNYKWLQHADAPSTSPCDGKLPKGSLHGESFCPFVIGWLCKKRENRK